MRKVVVSAYTTLDGVMAAPEKWNSHLIKENVAEAVSKLKQQPGQNIVMYGAGPVAQTLLQHGLIDDLRIWVYPVVAGRGEHLFDSATDIPHLRLVDTRAFNSGVVVLSYQPVSNA